MSIFQLLRLILICILCTWFVFVPDGSSYWVIWPCLIVFYIVAATALKPIEIKKGIKTYVTVRVSFYLYMYLLFFFPYQLYVLNLYNLMDSDFLIFTFVEKSNASILLSTIAVLAFDMGYKKKRRFKNYKIDNKVNNVIPWLFVVGLFIFELLNFASVKESLSSGGYSGSATGDATVDGIYFLSTVFSMWVSGVFLFYWANRSLTLIHWIGFVLVIIWIICLLLLGDRNNLFLILVVLLAGYSTFIKEVPLGTVLAGVAFAIVFYNVSEIARTADTRSIETFIDAFIDPSQFKKDSSKESSFASGSFGNTTVTARIALDVVPERQDYFYGKFKIVGFAGIIPYSRALIVSPGDLSVTSADVITSSALGRDATWGLGSNVVSDAYMDFGFPGVVVCLFLLGLVAGYLQDKTQLHVDSIKWQVIYLVMLATFFETPRYSVDFPVRPIVWAFIVFGVAGILQRSKNKI